MWNRCKHFFYSTKKPEEFSQLQKLTDVFEKKKQSKSKCRVFVEYCGIIQNIEELCAGNFIADSYMKIFEDNILNNFEKYFFQFFSQV